MAKDCSNCCVTFQITRQNAIHWLVSTVEFSFPQYNMEFQNDLVTDCKFNVCWQMY